MPELENTLGYGSWEGEGFKGTDQLPSLARHKMGQAKRECNINLY